MGYDKPKFTQIPNLLLDEQMAVMGDAELRVTLAIARQTFGWHKESDVISLSQLIKMTGLSRQGVVDGVKEGLERGTIKRYPEGQSFTYQLVIDEPTSQPTRPVLVNVVDQQLVNVVDTQKKGIKEREIKIEADACEASPSEWILKNLSIPDTEKFKEPPCEIQGSITKTTTENTTKSIEADACNGSASPTPSPTPRKTKKVASPESTALMEAYITLIKENEPGAVINYQREREGINRLAAAGCTPDRLVAAYRTLKVDKFWQSKHISSQSLGTQIGAILARVEDNQTTMELTYAW